MPYVLGIDIGSSHLKAAIRRAQRSGPGRAESLVLGANGDAVPSVLHVGADGSVLVGEAAEDCGPGERDCVVRGFTQRIGDQVPFILGGSSSGRAYPAHELFAAAISWVIDQAAYEAGGPPEHVAVTQPAGWSRYQLGVLRSAMDTFGLGRVTFVPELTAAALDYAAERRVDLGDLVAVCDVGSSAHRAAVLRRSSKTAFELLARPERAEPAAGTDPDDAVLAHVRAELGTGLDQLDLAEPGSWRAALELRRKCTAALETLVSAPQVAIPVSLPGVQTTVGMTRRQLEDRMRPAAEEAAELLRRAVRGAGVHPWQLSAVLLVGGLAQLSLVPQVISTELRRPVAVAANPKASTARGATVAAMHAVWPDSVQIAPAPGRELSRVGRPRSTPEPGGRGSGNPGAVVRRPGNGRAEDETMVLFTDVRPENIPDLDELADEMPGRPPLELTPLPFEIDHEPVSEQPMWKRIALGGGAVGGIVLVLALVAWFIFGSPQHSTPSPLPGGNSPAGATSQVQPGEPKEASTAESIPGKSSPAPDSSRTSKNSEDRP